MKHFFFMLFLSSIAHTQDYQAIYQRISQLKITYNTYLIALTQNTDPIFISNSYQNLKSKFITNISIEFPKDNVLPLFPLDFSNGVQVFEELSFDEKVNILKLDQIKLNVFLFVVLGVLRYHGNNNSEIPNTDVYAEFFKKSELKLLTLAKQAAISSSSDDSYLLDREYNILIQYLSRIPFPPPYSRYRSRRAYSIETPEAAKEEIARLLQELIDL